MATDNTTVIYSIGSTIRCYRQMKHISLTELAVAVGTNKAAISKIENGIRTPDLVTLGKIADELAIPISTFLTAPAQTGDKTEQMVSFLRTNKKIINSLNNEQFADLQELIFRSLELVHHGNCA